MPLALKSTAFSNNETIPARFSHAQANMSPGLQWTRPPNGTEAFALVVEDPDAPGGTFTHWLVYNMLPDTSELPEGTPSTPELDNGALQGRNDFGQLGYGGPQPPPGRPHHYRFRLFALREPLPLQAGASPQEFWDALRPRALMEAELTGTFQQRAAA